MKIKDSLNLPKTAFPMKADLVRREPETLARWETEALYAQIQEARKGAPAFVLHDGPPFANGDVHVGTALNKILKDFIVKHRAMTGHRAPYGPGWDCHGLPIEFKVAKDHASLGPLDVRRKCAAFATKYIDIQRRQFKRLGVLGDWERPYLTMERGYEAEILRVFAEFAGQGLVYRGRRPVHWSTGAQTALAEAEVEYAEKDSPAIFVKFPVVGMPKTSVVIWTTTPWTLPANLAVAIHPRFQYAEYDLGGERVILCDGLPGTTYEKLGVTPKPVAPLATEVFIKLKLRHPFLDREVPVLPADYVDKETGTGCVHTAPGHGQDDYHLAHHLGLLSPVDDQGRFTAECSIPSLVGKYVFDANADIVALLREKGSLVHEEKIRHSYPHCWRSKTPVIFRAVDQWFIRIEDFRKKALEAVGSVKWIPSWGENRIRGTIESRGDWCISRQRAWGVPLPIFYKPDGEAILGRELSLKVADLVEKHGTDVWFERDADALAAELGLPKGLRKSAETLDVWIDSGSSHRAVLARYPDLAFPADVYLEGSDQHRGWFQSSLLTSVVANGGRAPYRTVITHGFLVDLDGKKISKSSAYEKPKDAEAFVARYGADVLRLWVASEDYQGDVPLSEEIFARIGETYRSIRNSLRILLGNLHGFDPARDAVDFANPAVRGDPWCAVDLWMLDRLDKLVSEVRDAYDKYEFHRVYHAVNAFCAVTLSAFYVDVTKDRLYCDRPDSRRRRATQTVMHATASTLCRLLAPILSFTAEEAWGHLVPGGKSVHLQLLPNPSTGPATREAVEAVDLMLAQREAAARVIEAQRAAGKIGKSLEARVLLRPGEAAVARLAGLLPQLAEILIVSQAEVEPSTGEPEVAVPLGSKCERCWRWDNTVGNDASSPNLCARCTDAWKTALTLAPGETLAPDRGPCSPGRSGG